MYGLVNQAMEDMIRQEWGQSAWDSIKQSAGVEEGRFVSMRAYPDHITYDLVQAASQHSQESLPSLLEAFGKHWIAYTMKNGYGDMMDMWGSDLTTLLQNLDQMHARIGSSHSDFQPPSFVCHVQEDGSLLLEYHSQRPSLSHFVMGLILGLGEKFGTPVTVAQEQDKASGAPHDLFSITFNKA